MRGGAGGGGGGRGAAKKKCHVRMQRTCSKVGNEYTVKIFNLIASERKNLAAFAPLCVCVCVCGMKIVNLS
jgi:hypothetical protein